ncbi:MAG: DMT family transporter [Chloroflexi bacterium]|nr:DMT family transporter [Chloroflexota bacterium]
MFIGEASALASGILWAGTGVVIKTIGGRVSPIQLSAVQYWLAAGVLLLVAAPFGGLARLFGMPPGAAGLLVGSAVLNTLGIMAFYRAISLGDVGRSFTTMTSLFVLFSIGAGWAFLDDPITPVIIGGGLAIILGVYLVNRRVQSAVPAAAPQSRERRFGMGAAAMVTIAAAMATCGLVLTTKAVAHTDVVSAVIVRNAVPGLVFLFMVPRNGELRFARITRQDINRTVIAAALNGASGLTWMYGLQNTGATITAILNSTAPLWAVLFAALFLRERLNVPAFAGMALSVAGVFVVVMQR